MKPSRSNRSCRAFTLVEVAVVIFVLAVLLAMLLPGLVAAKKKSQRISCVNNLMQIGLSFRLWEGDHTNLYPMAVSTTNGGTMELAASQVVTATFLTLSNQLCTPYILFCPADSERIRAESFTNSVGSSNISYFLGLDANTDNPQMMLSGDGNFEIGGVPVKSGLLEISSNTPIAWSAARHKFAGNILVADGSVQQCSNSGLTNLLRQTGLATNRLAIP